MQKKKKLIGTYLLLLPVLTLRGQPESESPYSDQAYDPVDNPMWWETPFLWTGIIIFAFVLVFAIYQIRRRSKIKEELRREKEKMTKEENVSGQG